MFRTGCNYFVKFVAHPNCQQHLTNIWYGPEMGFLQSLTMWKKSIMWIVLIPLVPIFCIVYVVMPNTKVSFKFIYQISVRKENPFNDTSFFSGQLYQP